MGSAFHQLCPRYSGTLTPTAPTAIRLWDTFTFLYNIPPLCEVSTKFNCRSYVVIPLLVSTQSCQQTCDDKQSNFQTTVELQWLEQL